MRFYPYQHQFYCGIDLQARTMSVCILNHDGELLGHRAMTASPETFLQVIAPDREDIVVAVECIFTWYGLADLCTHAGLPFGLGQALYMTAIHGGKAKNDRLDARQGAVLLRGGMVPQAYISPAARRATPDLPPRPPPLRAKRARLLPPTPPANRQ